MKDPRERESAEKVARRKEEEKLSACVALFSRGAVWPLLSASGKRKRVYLERLLTARLEFLSAFIAGASSVYCDGKNAGLAARIRATPSRRSDSS